MSALKRVVLAVAALALLVLGGVAALTGLSLTAVFGPDGWAGSGTAVASSNGHALVALPHDLGHLPLGLPIRRVELTVRLADDGPVFVGIGPAAEVDAYLAGTGPAIVRATNLRPLQLQVVPVPGDGELPAKPEGLPFWVQSVSGAGLQTLAWDAVSGPWRVVVVRSDATAPVVADLSVQVAQTWAFPVGVALVVAGALMVVTGLVVAVAVVRPTRRPNLPPSYPGGYPPGYEPVESRS